MSPPRVSLLFVCVVGSLALFLVRAFLLRPPPDIFSASESAPSPSKTMDLKPAPYVSAAISRSEQPKTVSQPPLPDSTSGIPEMMPVHVLAKSLKDTGNIRAEARALMGVGVAADVAEEIVLAIDDAWSMYQRHINDNAFQASRTRLADDILLSMAPDIPRLIDEKRIEVTALPRAQARGRGSVGFTILPTGETINVEIQGKQWDIAFTLKHEFQHDSPLWTELANSLRASRAKMRAPK